MRTTCAHVRVRATVGARAGFSRFALSGAFWKLTEWASDGVTYDVPGPFRVGTAPIRTTSRHWYGR